MKRNLEGVSQEWYALIGVMFGNLFPELARRRVAMWMICCTFIITNFVYFGVGSVYSYFDITGTPKFLKKYKVRFLNCCYSYCALSRL